MLKVRDGRKQEPGAVSNEAELETLISTARSTSGGRFPELEFKLRSLEKGTPAI